MRQHVYLSNSPLIIVSTKFMWERRQESTTTAVRCSGKRKLQESIAGYKCRPDGTEKLLKTTLRTK